jgi:hypothetical protein
MAQRAIEIGNEKSISLRYMERVGMKGGSNTNEVGAIQFHVQQVEIQKKSNVYNGKYSEQLDNLTQREKGSE